MTYVRTHVKMAMRSARGCRLTAVTGVYRSLIAGGTRGLGRSIAKQSMRRGIEPVVLGRPRPDRSSTIEIDGEAVRFEPVRIEDDADVSRCIDRFKVTPSLNFRELFYLPGEHLKGRFCDQPEAAVRHLLDVTLFGLMNVDTSMFMDTDVVARLIWEEMETQDRGEWPALHELHVLRGPDGQPVLERRPKAPQ